MSKKDYLVGKTSRFSNTPGRTYEDTIKNRLDKRKFSTYKLASENLYNPPSPVVPITYVTTGYWDDYYVIEYDTNTYPTPPSLP